jgi:hypothetical protein
MYSTCIYCKRPLGSNDVLESFPVGRRIAFDPAKGRLWVVCRRCERWNLSPLEERWEAFEACERFFRDTRLRVSTDNIGLAKLKEGLELVRIGVPMRPEFAAWRYGDQFGRRRQRAILWTAAGITAVGAIAAGGIAVGIGAGLAPQIPNLILNIPIRARIRMRDGRVLKFRRPDVQKARLLAEPGDPQWILSVKHTKGTETFEGEDARRVAMQLLPAVNYMSGSKQSVQEAVARIESAGNPERYLDRIGREVMRKDPPHGYGRPLFPGKPGLIHKLPTPTRLALEMALHEEQEMRALAGELIDLELAWREAEEIARIADNMFTPAGFDEMLAEGRKQPEVVAAGQRDTGAARD